MIDNTARNPVIQFLVIMVTMDVSIFIFIAAQPATKKPEYWVQILVFKKDQVPFTFLPLNRARDNRTYSTCIRAFSISCILKFKMAAKSGVNFHSSFESLALIIFQSRTPYSNLI